MSTHTILCLIYFLAVPLAFVPLVWCKWDLLNFRYEEMDLTSFRIKHRNKIAILELAFLCVCEVFSVYAVMGISEV